MDEVFIHRVYVVLSKGTVNDFINAVKMSMVRASSVVFELLMNVRIS